NQSKTSSAVTSAGVRINPHTHEQEHRMRSFATAVIGLIIVGTTVLAMPQVALGRGQETGRKPTMPCDQLGNIKLKDVSSITAQAVGAGTFTPTGSAALNNLPAFCRVSLAIKPQINIEVWLPIAWNERFQAVGGGGYAGAISWPALATAVRSGY